MSSASLTYAVVPWDDPRAVELRAAMEAEMDERYGDVWVGLSEEEVAARLQALSVHPEQMAVTVLAFADGVAAGHGSLRPLANGDWEIKRVYVSPAWRGRGISRLLMTALEEEARARGAARLVLQTGDRQPDAVGLYERTGYRRIPVFEPYTLLGNSICYEKRLDALR